jgi:hypothetical protein
MKTSIRAGTSENKIRTNKQSIPARSLQSPSSVSNVERTYLSFGRFESFEPSRAQAYVHAVTIDLNSGNIERNEQTTDKRWAKSAGAVVREMSIANTAQGRRTGGEVDKRDDAGCCPRQGRGRVEEQMLEGRDGKVGFIATLESPVRQTIRCARVRARIYWVPLSD